MTLPDTPGHYWAKWRIATEATREGDELTPSDKWEVVQVNENGGKGNERLSVSVPGVEAVQWPDCFVWGPRIAEPGGSEIKRDLKRIEFSSSEITLMQRSVQCYKQLIGDQRVSSSLTAYMQHTFDGLSALERKLLAWWTRA